MIDDFRCTHLSHVVEDLLVAAPWAVGVVLCACVVRCWCTAANFNFVILVSLTCYEENTVLLWQLVFCAVSVALSSGPAQHLTPIANLDAHVTLGTRGEVVVLPAQLTLRLVPSLFFYYVLVLSSFDAVNCGVFRVGGCFTGRSRAVARDDSRNHQGSPVSWGHWACLQRLRQRRRPRSFGQQTHQGNPRTKSRYCRHLVLLRYVCIR